jgi:hypothetical protein
MDERFDWATTGVAPDGSQLMHIYRLSPDGEKSEPVCLDQTQSKLLNACLHQLAQDTSISWASARQAVLRGFYATLISSSRST